MPNQRKVHNLRKHKKDQLQDIILKHHLAKELDISQEGLKKLDLQFGAHIEKAEVQGRIFEIVGMIARGEYGSKLVKRVMAEYKVSQCSASYYVRLASNYRQEIADFSIEELKDWIKGKLIDMVESYNDKLVMHALGILSKHAELTPTPSKDVNVNINQFDALTLEETEVLMRQRGLLPPIKKAIEYEPDPE
jgi:hypothetical protein